MDSSEARPCASNSCQTLLQAIFAVMFAGAGRAGAIREWALYGLGDFVGLGLVGVGWWLVWRGWRFGWRGCWLRRSGFRPGRREVLTRLGGLRAGWRGFGLGRLSFGPAGRRSRGCGHGDDGGGLFGNGIGVVWILDCPKHDEGAHGPLIHEVLTGLITVQKR